MASLSYSQTPLLVKTQYQGENAFLGNEITMDSIFATYKNYEFLKIKYDSLSVATRLREIQFNALKIELEQFKKKTEVLGDLNSVFEKRFENQTKLHDTEILYYKEKAKGKFKAFLLGTTIGALIISILTII